MSDQNTAKPAETPATKEEAKSAESKPTQADAKTEPKA